MVLAGCFFVNSDLYKCVHVVQLVFVTGLFRRSFPLECKEHVSLFKCERALECSKQL